MPGNSFGQSFRVTTAGESHGRGNVVIIDGCPPGIPFSESDIQPDLDRRRPGQSRLTTARKEPDRAEILAGTFEGKTTGTSIAIFVANENQRSGDYDAIKAIYRPGHADYTYDKKYGHRDYRGGGRASARETVARVAAASLARKVVQRDTEIEVTAYVVQVGKIQATLPDRVTRQLVDANAVRCPDPVAAEKMALLIDEVRRDCDSIGGIAEVVVTGVPAGLGEPVFDKLKADLAKAMLSIPGVMGFEYGMGFVGCCERGSQRNDPYVNAQGTITTTTNNHGGMLGGISSGENIRLRVALKPTASIARKQQTVTKSGDATEISVHGRHDPCLLPRFVPVAEAMVYLVLADHWLRQKQLDAKVDR